MNSLSPTRQFAARRVRVNGIVQGVGFRPFVYQSAQQFNLAGTVANTSAGVDIFIQGRLSQIDQFIDQLRSTPPPLARIFDIQITPAQTKSDCDFSIVSSSASSGDTLISPDVSICQDCLRELFDPQDRRHRYPFINCTNCGPRFTIIADVPYDRPQTSMKRFVMCKLCQAEYDDPANRRFHAQPNACPDCGPQVQFFDRDRRLIGGDPVAAAIQKLQAGAIVAVKGLGGFHLAADAANPAAIDTLRQRKHRPEKPLAIMAKDINAIRQFAQVDAVHASVLTSPRRPIVLLPKCADGPIAENVAPNNRYLGVMLAYTPLHYLLLDAPVIALVMTSGNVSGQPICADNDDAFAQLGAMADFFLIHDRNILHRADDSIARVSAGAVRLLRRSRGYTPEPIFLKHPLPPILACGAGMKNTICLTKGRHAFVSQHIGELESVAAEAFFHQTIHHLQHVMHIRPQAVACDRHPDYPSSRWAEALAAPPLPLIRVQHHHAHIAAVMAEHGLDGPVIGLALDGAGLGTDGCIWGGEALIAGFDDFKRAAALQYVPMPGGDAAVKSPWRMAVSYLMDAYGERFDQLNLPLIDRHRPSLTIISKMIRQNINSPLTSSTGRLFDAAAALIGLRDDTSFDGQAAMELESVAADSIDAYEISAPPPSDPIRIATAPIIRAVVEDVLTGTSAPIVSARFHATMVQIFADLCCALRDRYHIDQVALGGGVFQNELMLNGLTRKLSQTGFAVYAPLQMPANDGAIALGQAMVAAARLG